MDSDKEQVTPDVAFDTLNDAVVYAKSIAFEAKRKDLKVTVHNTGYRKISKQSGIPMKNTLRFVLCSVTFLSMLAVAYGEPSKDPLDAAREALKADRQATVASAVQLTDAEAKDFWPIYHQYRSAMDAVGDQLIKLVRSYAEAYPDVTEDAARELLREYAALEKKYLATRSKFFKKVGEVLPATKTLRFVQVENRLDLVLRLELAAGIPLAPGKK